MDSRVATAGASANDSSSPLSAVKDSEMKRSFKKLFRSQSSLSIQGALERSKSLLKKDAVMRAVHGLYGTRIKVVVLGASGPLGREVVREAIRRKYDVIALVRNTDRFNLEGSEEVPEGVSLRAASVNVFDYSTLKPHMFGADAVISCLGATDFLSFWHCTLYSTTIAEIVRAMQDASVRRLICTSSWCTINSKAHPAYIEYFLKPLFIGALLKDMRRMELYLEGLEEFREINYTVVKCPSLTKQPSTSKPVQAVESQWVQEASVHEIPRPNVAVFMLDALNTVKFDKKLVAIGV